MKKPIQKLLSSFETTESSLFEDQLQKYNLISSDRFRSTDGWRPRRIYAPQLFQQPETAAVLSTYNYEATVINETRPKTKTSPYNFKLSYYDKRKLTLELTN